MRRCWPMKIGGSLPGAFGVGEDDAGGQSMKQGSVRAMLRHASEKEHND
jgi:hypothetical protein